MKKKIFHPNIIKKFFYWPHCIKLTDQQKIDFNNEVYLILFKIITSKKQMLQIIEDNFNVLNTIAILQPSITGLKILFSSCLTGRIQMIQDICETWPEYNNYVALNNPAQKTNEEIYDFYVSSYYNRPTRPCSPSPPPAISVTVGDISRAKRIKTQHHATATPPNITSTPSSSFGTTSVTRIVPESSSSRKN